MRELAEVLTDADELCEEVECAEVVTGLELAEVVAATDEGRDVVGTEDVVGTVTGGNADVVVDGAEMAGSEVTVTTVVTVVGAAALMLEQAVSSTRSPARPARRIDEPPDVDQYRFGKSRMEIEPASNSRRPERPGALDGLAR